MRLKIKEGISKDFISQYSDSDIDKILEYLADEELKEFKSGLTNNNLTVYNIKKVFDKGWQWWNTYSSDESIDLVDDNGIDCDNVDFDLVDWDEVIRLAKTDDTFDYNLHQYADYACIFMDFKKTGLIVDSPFLNEYALENLYEDIDNGKFTKTDLDKILGRV